MKPKNDYMEKSRGPLSEWINFYISQEANENPQYGVAHFAREVDQELKSWFLKDKDNKSMKNEGENSARRIDNSKKVYKWTNKEVLPDLPTIVIDKEVLKEYKSLLVSVSERWGFDGLRNGITWRKSLKLKRRCFESSTYIQCCVCLQVSSLHIPASQLIFSSSTMREQKVHLKASQPKRHGSIA